MLKMISVCVSEEKECIDKVRVFICLLGGSYSELIVDDFKHDYIVKILVRE